MEVLTKDYYVPQPKQAIMHASPANELLVGGAAGPGKSHFIRWEAFKWAIKIPNLQIYLFRRTFQELEDNHVIPSMLQYPHDVCTYKEQKKRWEFPGNGSMIHFCHCQYEKDVFIRQGAEIHLLLIDELTTFTEFIYDYLRGRVRCTLPIPEQYQHKIPGIICSANPGGVGHQFCKERWVDFAKPYELKRAPDGEGGMMRQYIPGLLKDNPKLLEADPMYEKRLMALPEPYRSAYLEGKWDIFMGQMFAFTEKYHVIDPMPVPDDAPLYMTFDWGFGAPYHVGWYWLDDEDRLYLFSELYGAMPHPPSPPNTGLRQTDDVIADEIIKKEKQLEIGDRHIHRLCDPTSFNKKPDYKGGGQGPSTAEEFATRGLILNPADPSRILKIRQFHQRLRIPPKLSTGEQPMPMLVVYRCCEAFRRTVPMLQADKNNQEDIPLKGIESHCFAGDTEVITPNGNKGIRSLVGTRGVLWGPDGQWHEYTRCWRTRVMAETVVVTFEDGLQAQCTPDHLFMMIDGTWKKAVDITDGECYVSTLWKQSSLVTRFKSSTESGITSLADTSSMLEFQDFTQPFGHTITANHHQGIMSTIRTLIGKTTRSKTLTYCQSPTTSVYTPSAKTIRHGLPQCTKEQRSGTAVQRARSGTRSIGKRIVRRLSVSGDPCSARDVARHSWERIGLNSVPADVRLLTGRKERIKPIKGCVQDVEWSFTATQNLAANSVRQPAPRSIDGKLVLSCVKAPPADVFCFSVPSCRAFALSNGVIVHNCYDSCAQVVMARPVGGMETPKPRKGPGR